jgi:vancomycin resistance protein VanJ
MEVPVDRVVAPARADSVRRRRLVVAARALAVIYPFGLLVAVVVLRWVGESWWVSTIGLYLPRLVLGVPLPFVALALLALRQGRWLWSQLASVFFLLFPLMGLVLPWPRSADAGAPTMRLLSYNINSGHGGVEQLVEEMDRFSPDVVLLQEIGHRDELEAVLRARFPTVDLWGQFALASRYPLLARDEPEKLPFYGQLRSPRCVRAVLDTPLGRIVLYNVHPISPREDFGTLRGHGLRREILSGRLFSGSSAPVIQENAALRGREIEGVAQVAAKETDPVIVAGDTNLPTLSKVFGRYLSGYQDGFAKAGAGFGYTYPNDRRPWMRIDRILATDALKFVGFEVGASKASDHLCVVATLQRQ